MGYVDLKENDVEGMLEYCKGLIRKKQWHDQVLDHLSPYFTKIEALAEFKDRFVEEIEPLLEESK